jgi:predicted ATPase
VHFEFAKAPFLRSVRYSSPFENRFPFNLPLFKQPFEIKLQKPIAIFVGENGTGKSTLLEGIVSKCGFALEGGNRNHAKDREANSTPLDPALDLSWSHKVNTGFFLRAETFSKFATMVDEQGLEFAYGGKSLHAQSHGESFMSLFDTHFDYEGIYILDEPEAALSPVRQLAFLRILHDMEKSTHIQVIMATHSPILLSYPGAQVMEIADGKITEANYEETEHFKVTRDFLQNPGRFFKHLFADE